MNPTELKQKISNLSIWKRGDERAPHKPLLILYALGQMQNNNARVLPYEEIKNPMKDLLREFGPRRRSYHPEEPFVRLTKDGIWDLNADLDSVHINSTWLAKHGIAGGFNKEAFALLHSDPELVREVAEIVLNRHFPETIHEDILTAVGLSFDLGTINKPDSPSVSGKSRDPRFRDRVLRAYEYCCAVCGFNVRLGNNPIGVEAAHIKWHQAGGPDSEDNGMALCAMHHKMFDRGVFTVSESKELLVAQDANGTNGLDEWLMRYNGRPIRPPVHPDYEPKPVFVAWHIREVFRGPARYQIK